jgi:hypothetical protein
LTVSLWQRNASSKAICLKKLPRWGVVAVDTLTGAEIAVAEGRAPAGMAACGADRLGWRCRFVQDGEQVVTLEPPSFDEGMLYRISYLDDRRRAARDGALLHLATTPDFWAKQGITALLVTGDGRLITDAVDAAARAGALPCRLPSL